MEVDRTIFYKDNDLCIRQMNKEDIDIILSNFYEQGWPKARDVLVRYFSGQNSGELYIFIAEFNNDIAGYAVLYPNAEHGPFAN